MRKLIGILGVMLFLAAYFALGTDWGKQQVKKISYRIAGVPEQPARFDFAKLKRIRPAPLAPVPAQGPGRPLVPAGSVSPSNRMRR